MSTRVPSHASCVLRSGLRQIAAAILVLGFSLQVHAGEIFGRADVGLIPSAGMRADFKRGSKFSLNEAATVYGICAYLDGKGGGAGAQAVRFAIYHDENNAPGAKIAETGESGYYAGYPGSWVCDSPGFRPLPAGTYWLVIQSSGSSGVLRYYYDGPADWFGNADSYVDGTADPFGSGSAGSGTISIYAQYTRSVHTAGRTTVGSVPSNGITPDFKRASSFTVTETGMFQGITVYLDGLAGGSGREFIRSGLYRDASGVPGARLGQTNSVNLFAGEPGRWRSDSTPNFIKLTPGRYWVALQHFAGATGVARYALDGTGNWYGNVDAWADGMSDPFGPATAGNGTISAFVSYRPGTFVAGRFGRTDVASTPLQGLRPNYIRGSRFHFEPTHETYVDALYAYLDGKGGTSGSQEVRMALYFDDRDAGPTPVLAAVSDAISIAAGTGPGWVRFPVPLTAAGGDYWIMIQSGDAGGSCAAMVMDRRTGEEMPIRFQMARMTRFPATPHSVASRCRCMRGMRSFIPKIDVQRRWLWIGS